MNCKSYVNYIEIVCKDRLLLGEWRTLELMNVSTMKSLNSIEIESLI